MGNYKESDNSSHIAYLKGGTCIPGHSTYRTKPFNLPFEEALMCIRPFY